MRAATPRHLVLLLTLLGATLAPRAAVGQGGTESLPLGPPESTTQAGEPGGGGSGGPFDLDGYLRTILALGFVVGLALVSAAALKKLAKGRGGLLGAIGPGGPSPSGVMEILGRYPVGPGQTLVLLKLDRRVLLLHQSSGRKNASMRTLAEITGDDEVASILMATRETEDENAQKSFREAMRRLERDFSAYEEPSPARVTHASPDGDRAELLAVEAPHAEPAGGDDELRSRLRRWIGEARG